jgi:hypothetical protein
MVHQELLSGLAGGVPREAAFSIVRLSQSVLLADSYGFQPCCRLFGAGLAPASRLASPAPAATLIAAAEL